jgi:hypothetical protein
VRAERRLGEVLRAMAENGERKIQGNAVKSRDATSLEELGIPKDRASRAMQLADVPEDQFEAALAEPRIAQPRRILEEIKGAVPITKTLNLWGRVRDLGAQAVVAAHDAGAMDGENYDIHWPLSMAIDLLEQASGQLDVNHG